MPHKRLLILLLLGLAACSPENAVDTGQALLIAQEMREGCVADNLGLMLGLVEYLSPLSTVRDMDDLVDRTSVTGCTLIPGELILLECRGVVISDDVIDLHAELDYIAADGFPTSDPSQAVSLRITIDALGAGSHTEGMLVCTPDPALGLVLEGGISTYFDGGCLVTTELDGVTAQFIADLPGGGSLVFTSGSADLGVDDDGVPLASGTAALVGRSALVALEVSGVYSQGEIDLDR